SRIFRRRVGHLAGASKTESVTLGSEPVTRSRMLSNGISAPSGLQYPHDSISFSASRKVAAPTNTTFCSSGVGSKKSQVMRPVFHNCALAIGGEVAQASVLLKTRPAI